MFWLTAASVSDFYDFDSEIIVMNLPSLNNGGDKVILMDDNSFIIDSLTYTSSWGGSSGGRSLERILFDQPSHESTNWGTSVSPDKATPGGINSISPKDFDLLLSEINISPSPPIENTDLTAELIIKNIGNNNANTYTIELYNDENFDNTPQAGELIDSFELTNLASGDSVSQTFSLGSFDAGNVQFIGRVIFNQDEDNTNNELIYEFTVFPPPPDFNDIVINEIMYAPSEAETEWVEIYNRSNQAYDLINWQFADAANTALITTSSITIEPGEFVVLAKDASV
ncbi:MAG: lamin tail domain-containing protein [Melioribacteraceae bacterium]|nr:lamin tail domain-containing protein [Melioribacteraceae bacterium]